MQIESVTLEGIRVRLEALEPRHGDAFVDAALADPDLFKWFTEPRRTRGEHERFFKLALQLQERGENFSFATIDKASGKLVGSTAMTAIAREHRRLEIGSTWITPAFQRTHVNTEAKLLMLGHCFETLGCIRVEFKTDALNERSRRAIFRLGCKEEGILRSHAICSDGRIRDTVYFSVIAPEWPAVKARLETIVHQQTGNA